MNSKRVKAIPVFVEHVENTGVVRRLFEAGSERLTVLNSPHDETLQLTLNILDEHVTVEFRGDKAKELAGKIAKVLAQAG